MPIEVLDQLAQHKPQLGRHIGGCRAVSCRVVNPHSVVACFDHRPRAIGVDTGRNEERIFNVIFGKPQGFALRRLRRST